jgi:hypothetical protein
VLLFLRGDVFAEFNYGKGVAELRIDDALHETSKMVPKHPAKGKKSSVLAIFKGIVG